MSATIAPHHQHQLGFDKFSNLDPLNKQHLQNMFNRLCRSTSNNAKNVVDDRKDEEKLIHVNALPTLLGSVGLVQRPKHDNNNENNDHNNSLTLSSSASVVAAGDGADDEVHKKQNNSNSSSELPTFLNFDQVVQKYDEAVEYCSRAMAECMEFFAMLDDDGDGVVDVGVLRTALCGTPEERSGSKNKKTSSKNQQQLDPSPSSFLISEAEFYFALDAAKLLTGPENVAITNFDHVTGSRLANLKVDDELHEEDNGGGGEGGEAFIPPPTSDHAAETGTVVPGGLTVYQFLNVVLKFAL